MDNSNEYRQLDELFKRKLEGHDSPVGEELWNRLNKRRLSKPGPAWYSRKFMAAAIVSGIAVAGGIWLSMPAEKERLSALTPGNVQDAPQRVAHEAELPAVTDSISPGYADATIPAPPVFADAGKKTAGAESAGTRKDIPVQPDLKKSGEVASRAGENEPAAADPAPAPQRESENKQAETRVLIVYVRPPAKLDEAEEKPGGELMAVTESVKSEVVEERKKLSLKRLFRQLKNAKTGEKINWEELGISPQRVFANVDHSGVAPAGEK
ncbi:MAG: hypothetical protein ABS46_16745 [Cytophagaceae bacterium SCN 52-12]|nr:MAG: hypothetical protein ABS46_16745 [Cytophagaceae bacterium SCN 52-12]